MDGQDDFDQLIKGIGVKLATPKQIKSAYDDFIEQSAKNNGIDPDLIRAQMSQESSFNPNAVSNKSAKGLMQIIPATAQRFGVKNVFDPQQNIEGGAKYMKWLLDRFDGNVDLALAGYNAGEGAVEKYGRKIPPYKETQDYVSRIRGKYQGNGYLSKVTENDIFNHIAPKPITEDDVFQNIGQLNQPTNDLPQPATIKITGQNPNGSYSGVTSNEPLPQGFQSEPDPAYMAQFYKDSPFPQVPIGALDKFGNPTNPISPTVPTTQTVQPPKVGLPTNPIYDVASDGVIPPTNQRDIGVTVPQQPRVAPVQPKPTLKPNQPQFGVSVGLQDFQPIAPTVAPNQPNQPPVKQFRDEKLTLKLSDKPNTVGLKDWVMSNALPQIASKYKVDVQDLEKVLTASSFDTFEDDLRKKVDKDGLFDVTVPAEIIKRANYRQEKRVAVEQRIKNGETQEDAMLQEGLLTPEDYTTAKYEMAQAQKVEDEARAKFEQENTLTDEDAYRQSALSQGYVLPEQVKQNNLANVEAKKADILQKYGSFDKYYKEQARIEKEYGTFWNPNPARPMARQAEFIKNLASTVPDAVAAVSKTVDILGEVMPITPQNIYSVVTNGKEFNAKDGAFYQFGDAIAKRLEKSQNKDLQANTFDNILTNIAPKALGQIGIQMALGVVTGGATAPVLLGSAMGAAEQYDEASKNPNTTPTQRKIAAIVGGVAAISDAIPFAKFLSPLNKVEKLGFLGKFLGGIFGKASAEIGEEAAVEATKGALANFLKKSKTVLAGMGLEGFQELTEKKTNDLVARMTYDPNRQVLMLSNEDIMEFLGGAIGGVGGAGLEIALESQTEQDAPEVEHFVNNLLNAGQIQNVQTSIQPLSPEQVDSKIAETNQNLAQNKPVPEAPETNEYQLESAQNPETQRVAVLYTDGEQEPTLPKGFIRVPVAEGVLQVNADKAKAIGLNNAQDIAQDVAQNGVSALIGKVDEVKDTSQADTLFSTDKATGKEVSASVVTSPESAQAQAELDQLNHPNLELEQEILPTQEAVKKRNEIKTEPAKDTVKTVRIGKDLVELSGELLDRWKNEVEPAEKAIDAKESNAHFLGTKLSEKEKVEINKEKTRIKGIKKDIREQSKNNQEWKQKNEIPQQTAPVESGEVLPTPTLESETPKVSAIREKVRNEPKLKLAPKTTVKVEDKFEDKIPVTNEQPTDTKDILADKKQDIQPNIESPQLSKGDQVEYKGQTFEVDKVASSGRRVALKGEKPIVAPVDKVKKVAPKTEPIAESKPVPKSTLEVGEQFTLPNNSKVIYEVQPQGQYKNKGFYKIKNLSTGEVVNRAFNMRGIAQLKFVDKVESKPVQTETDNEIEAVPISQRVDVSNLEDAEFTRSEVARKAKTEKIRSKTGFTKTQEEWFIGELQKEYDKLEPTAKMVQMDKGSLANLVWELGRDKNKYTGKSPDFIRTTPEYLEAKQQYESDIKNAVVIDIPGDGVFKFSSAYGINKIHKKLTGKTIEDFRKANNKDYELPSLPKNYGKAGKEAQIRQEDETDITVPKVNELLGDAPATSKELSDLGVKQVSNGYWIQNNDGLNGFTFEPNPKPVQLSNLKGYDLFAHKYNTVKGNSSSKYSEWRVSDAVTGRMLISGETLDEVIEKAKNVKQEQFEKALTKGVNDTTLSPRYEKSQPPEKSSALKMVADQPAMRSSVMQGQPLFKKTDADTAQQKELRKHETIEKLIPQMKSQVTSDGVEISLADAEIIRRINDTLTDADIDKSSSIDGLFINPSMVTDILDGLEGIIENGQESGYDAQELKGLTDLKKNIESSAKENGTTILYAFDDAVKHEKFHQIGYLNAREYNKVLTSRIKDFKGFVESNQDILQKAHDNFFSNHGYDAVKDVDQIVEETATYIATGDYARLGLDSKEAADYLDNWFQSYLAQNGADSLNDFETFAKGLDLAENAINKIKNGQEKEKEIADNGGVLQQNQESAGSGEEKETSGTLGTDGESGRLPARSAEVEKRQNAVNTPINFESQAKASKVGLNIEAQAIADDLTKGFEGSAEYQTINVKDQAKRAADIINNDLESARRMLAGKEILPASLRGASLIAGMERYARQKKDIELLKEIANSPLTAETSVHAQELRMIRERQPNSPVQIIQDIQKARTEAAQKRLGKTVKEAVKDESQKIKDEVKKVVINKSKWDKFVQEIMCK